ncbi:N-methyltransferase [Trichophyton interdigitale]|uniref:N-methyltransferase n=1 Tax=Trichophyton interdigitale TaxID=101480 RepID=A0A9P4YFH0_9EURO|nr:N-methyltransferase [Trichophyton interdigitale]KAF3894506.1 N-methyltransferase [Trichophyton interdigitale]KAG8208506.1 N-methyltransferase [Trichophyton interdigitale]
MRSITPQYRSVDGIIDVGHPNGSFDMKLDILKGLCNKPREFPSVLIWDDRGSELYEKLCEEPAYYPRSCEIDILQKHCSNIVGTFSDFSILIELGCGNLQKTGAILAALKAQGKKTFYYALDVSLDSLKKNLRDLSAKFCYSSTIRVTGLLGTYAGCARWVESSFDSFPTNDITFLWMGNTIANTEIQDAANLLASFRQACRGTCSFIFGADACSDESRIRACYNDRPGYFHAVVANGMNSTNAALGREVFNPKDWKVRVRFDRETRMVRCSHVCQRNLNLEVMGHIFSFSQGTEINQLLSGKWSPEQIAFMSQLGGFTLTNSWMDKEEIYGFYRIESAQRI